MTTRFHVGLCAVLLCGILITRVSESQDNERPSPLDLARQLDETDDMARGALLAAAVFNPALNVEAYVKRVDDMADELRQRMAHVKEPRRQLEVIRRYLYGERRYGRGDILPPTRYLGLDEVIDGRQWNCVGLSVLYVALAERVGIDLRIVSGPQHVFILYNDPGNPLSVETTERGAVYDTPAYLVRKLAHIACLDVAEQFRPLNSKQVFALLLVQSAGAHFPGDRVADARPYFEAALGLDDLSADAHYALGTSYLVANEPQRSLSAFKQAISLDPRQYEAAINLSIAHRRVGEGDQSVRVLQELIEACPQYGPAHYNLGILLFEQRDFEGAVVQYRAAIRLNPDDPTTRLNLAVALAEIGKIEDALRAVNMSIYQDKTRADAYAIRGSLQFESDNVDVAITDFRTALSINSEHVYGRNGLGLAFLRKGEMEARSGHAESATALFSRAIAQFEYLVKQNLADPETLTNLAKALAAIGRLEEALEATANAALIDPAAPETFLVEAMIASQHGDTARARQALKKYRMLGGNPNHPEATRLTEGLNRLTP